MKTEPLISVGLVVAFATAVIGLLRAFGIGVSVEQEGAVIEFIKSSYEVVFILAGFVFARNFVYSQASVEKLTGTSEPIVPEVPASPAVTREIHRGQ